MDGGATQGVTRQFISSLYEAVKGLGLDSFFPSQPGKCRGCNKYLWGNQEEFCSFRCIHNFWVDIGKAHAEKSGNQIPVCALPGCTKPCYQGVDGKFEDYCTRTHANTCQEQLRQMYGGVISELKKCRLHDCKKLCLVTDHGYVLDHCSTEHSHLTCFCKECRKKWGKRPIYFYNSYDPFYEFSNFFDHASFTLDDEKWKTTEHYFQAQKFIGTPYREHIRHLNSPREAFDFARRREVLQWKRPDWEDVKLCVMYKALLAKFSAHERLRTLISCTDKRDIVERTSNDDYWGDGGYLGGGKNHLGKLLEDIRRVLQGEKSIHLKK